MFSNFRALASLSYVKYGTSRSSRLHCMQSMQFGPKVQETLSVHRLIQPPSKSTSRCLSAWRLPNHGIYYSQSCGKSHAPAIDVNARHITEVNEQLSVETYTSYLVLNHPSLSHDLKLHYFWLRDHCRCAKCYSATTYQRSNDIMAIPEDIQPLECTLEGDILRITWNDGHHSEYNVSWLIENTYETQRLTPEKVEKVTWDADKFKSLQLPSITFQRLLEDDNVLRELIRSIVVYGIGLIHQVPASTEGTQQTVKRVGPIMNTFYGMMFDFTAGDTEFQDSAYTSDALGAHTDLTYFTEASGVQVFHILNREGKGGQSLLVDGFNVAKKFKKTNPDDYRLLTNTVTGGEYVGSQKHHVNIDAIFKHHPVTKQLIQVRYNLYDRGPLTSIPFEDLGTYYRCLRELTREMRRPENEIWIQLEPGTVILIDNWRVLHGRAAFTGQRTMSGCYMARSDLLSMARVLGVI